MRPSCLNCARKHLAKASILMAEAKLGYASHKWLAIGNMSEAEDELLRDWHGYALMVREHRKAYEEDMDYIVPILELIEMLCDEENNLRSQELRRADSSG